MSKAFVLCLLLIIQQFSVLLLSQSKGYNSQSKGIASNMSNVLQELGPDAVSHRAELEEVKRQVGVRHEYFDCWIYGFLENKKFDIEETVQKLRRRDTMERNELASYEITDYMRETMSKGIIQLIGDDKEGRVTFYIVTKRDFPTSKRREENKRNFDMWISYGTRLRKENKRGRITMLINQKDASMWSNTDMTFQADVALRIAKFYPGCVDRMYVCKMSNTLATMAKPIFSRLPAIVSDKIRIFTESDLQKGKLLDLFDASVLPVDLGGQNDCDGQANWTAFANTIERHFVGLKDAVGNRDIGVKEWELENLQKELAENATTGRERKDAQKLARASRRFGSVFVAPNDATHETSDLARSVELNHHQAAYGTMEGCAAEDENSDDLQSCISYDDDYYFDDDDPVNLPNRQSMTGSIFGEPDSTSPRPTQGIHHEHYYSNAFVTPHHRFLLEQERRWRLSIANEESERRLLLCDRQNDSYHITEEQLEDVFGEVGTKRLMTYVPAPARAMLNVFLQACCVLSAIYFAASTIFVTSIACSIVVTFFFGMFVDPKFVFPIGVAMLLASFEGALLCSRGVELTRLSYYGRLLPGFRYFGSYAQLGQLLFTLALILTQFIIFVVYAVQWDTLNGLKVAFATGWLSCTILVALHHILYWAQPKVVEWDPNTSAHDRTAHRKKLQQQQDGSNKSSLPIYLLFDITEDDEEETSTGRTSAVIFVLIPVVVSILFGAAFLVSKILALAVAVPIATLIAAWAVHAYVDAATSRFHAVLTKFVVWFGSIVWQYDCYVFGFRDYSSRWGVPVGISSAILALFMFMALIHLKKHNSSRLFRLILLMIVGYVLACAILSFVVVDWTLGVFVVVMAIHAGLCASRGATASAVNIGGRFIASTGTALLLIAIVMLGWLGTTHQYSTPRAMTGGAVPTAADVLSFEQFQRSPLCSLQMDLVDTNATTSVTRVPSNRPFTPLDMVLLTELSASFGTPATLLQDLAEWLPDTTLVDTRTFAAATSEENEPSFTTLHFVTATAPVGQSETANVSVLVVLTPNKFHSIRAMSAWAEAMALSPLSIFLPINWTSSIIDPYSFSSRMVPFEYRGALSELEDYINTIKVSGAATYGSTHRLYVSGWGVAGGIAQLAGTRTFTMAVGVNAPGIMHLLGKFDIAPAVFASYVLSITADDAALTTVGGSSIQQNTLSCGHDADTCQGISFVSEALIRSCRDSRRHS